MRLVFYGARGSIPTPLTLDEYQAKIKEILTLYSMSVNKNIDNFIKELPFCLSHICGGNTSCVSIEDDSIDDIIILDAGSGLRNLSKKLINKNNLKIHIFLTHFHWDHICGIPFFKAIYNSTNNVTFYSPDENLKYNLERQQHHSHFPLPFEKLPAKKHFVILDKENPFHLNGFDITNILLNHPGGAYGYIFIKDNKKISYVTDTEFTPDNIKEKNIFYKACFENSDVLIMDSQYSLSEFFSKFEWGHTSSTMAINLALEWRVKKIVLYHFDPDHTDKDLLRIMNEAKAIKSSKYNKRNLEIIQAYEGLKIEI